jgi:mono/diheme cytochrome c family protein
MGRFCKWLLIGFVIVIVLLCAAITFTVGWRPFIGPKTRPLTSRTFERTPQRLERGKYIATAVSGCIYCHTPHQITSTGTTLTAGMEGAGEIMPYELPGRIVASNITPDPETGAGTWTDDQLSRAIREGIGHDGRTLFPLMPYGVFRYMSDEDLASVVVYLRSLPPIRRELPKTEIISPVKYLIRSAPEPITEPVVDEPTTDPVKRGQHLATLGGCTDCHTVSDKGQELPGMAFAGGAPFPGPWGYVASANLTPDASGISYYDEALFVEAMRTGKVRGRVLSGVMPTVVLRNQTDEDLKAIFAYLRTLKPVHHRVDNSLPPTYCKLCRQKHGAGEQN